MPAVRKSLLVALIAVATLCGARPVQAGCGCDHPPPLRGDVYPRFAWPLGIVNVSANGLTTPQPCLRFGGHVGKTAPALAGIQPVPSSDPDLCAAGLKPEMLTFEYTGQDCRASSNTQLHAKCEGDPLGAARVHIVAQQVSGNKDIWFDGIVTLHQQFTLDARHAERLQFTGADTTLTISNPQTGKVLQTITLRTSCAQPLLIGDQYGSLIIRAFTPEPKPTDEAEAVVPDLALGPQAVDVFNTSCDQVNGQTVPLESLPASDFTVISAPIPIVELEGTVKYQNVEAAVAADGTLLIPFDMTRVMHAMQFFTVLKNLPLRFTVDQLIYYNKDQYNLKLFTSMVGSPDEYLWGPYYGTTVTPNTNPKKFSDTIGYWRHEFQTYYTAHLPGGSYETDPEGLHPDGTRHIDHYFLVAAIGGLLQGEHGTADPSTWTPLKPGKVTVDVEVMQLFTDGPVDLTALTLAQKRTLHDNHYQVQMNNSSNTLKGVIKLEVRDPFDGLIPADAPVDSSNATAAQLRAIAEAQRAYDKAFTDLDKARVAAQQEDAKTAATIASAQLQAQSDIAKAKAALAATVAKEQAAIAAANQAAATAATVAAQAKVASDAAQAKAKQTGLTADISAAAKALATWQKAQADATKAQAAATAQAAKSAGNIAAAQAKAQADINKALQTAAATTARAQAKAAAAWALVAQAEQVRLNALDVLNKATAAV